MASAVLEHCQTPMEEHVTFQHQAPIVGHGVTLAEGGPADEAHLWKTRQRLDTRGNRRRPRVAPRLSGPMG